MKSKTSRLERIYRLLRAEGCTRVHSLALVCAEAGVKVSDIAIEAGVPRGYMNLMLSDARPLRDAVRKAYINLLGFDPWEIEGRKG